MSKLPSIFKELKEFEPKVLDVKVEGGKTSRLGLVFHDFAILPPTEHPNEGHWTILYLPTGTDVRFCGFHHLHDAVPACREVVSKHSAQFNISAFHTPPTVELVTKVTSSLLDIAFRHNACSAFIAESLIDLVCGEPETTVDTSFNKDK